MRTKMIVSLLLAVAFLSGCVSMPPIEERLNYADKYVSNYESFFKNQTVIEEANGMGFVNGKFMVKMTAVSNEEVVAEYISIPNIEVGVPGDPYLINISKNIFEKIEWEEANKLISDGSSKRNYFEKDGMSFDNLMVGVAGIEQAEEGDFFGEQVSQIFQFDLVSYNGDHSLNCYELWSTKSERGSGIISTLWTKVDVGYIWNGKLHIVEAAPWREVTPRNYRHLRHLQDMRLSPDGKTLFVNANSGGDSKFIDIETGDEYSLYDEIGGNTSVSPDWSKYFMSVFSNGGNIVGAVELKK